MKYYPSSRYRYSFIPTSCLVTLNYLGLAFWVTGKEDREDFSFWKKWKKQDESFEPPVATECTLGSIEKLLKRKKKNELFFASLWIVIKSVVLEGRNHFQKAWIFLSNKISLTSYLDHRGWRDGSKRRLRQFKNKTGIFLLDYLIQRIVWYGWIVWMTNNTNIFYLK